MNKILLILVIVFLSMSHAFAMRNDEYVWGIGPRVSYAFGLDFKTFVSDNTAIDAVASHEFEDFEGYKLSVTYQYQDAFTRSRTLAHPSIEWFVGIGLHVSYYK